MPAVIDVKSGAPNRSIRYQLAGYKILVEESIADAEPCFVDFEEATHVYRMWKGGARIRVPSVTQVLDSVGLAQCSPYVSEEALWWGQQIHLMVEMFHAERLDEDKLDPLLWPRLEGYKMFVQDYGFKSLWTERSLGSRKYGFGGRPDLYGLMKRDEPNKLAGHVKRYSVHLTEDRKYNVVSYDAYSDETVFLHAVAVEQEKLRVGLSK